MNTSNNWPEEIHAWSASGLSKQKFCNDRGLAYQSFLYHFNRKKVKEEPSSFRQVILPDLKRDEQIEFHYSDGRCVCFPVSTPKDIVRFLVSL